jgi:hypothetical protein
MAYRSSPLPATPGVPDTQVELGLTLGPSLGRGVLAGLGTGALAGLVWFAIVAFSNTQFYYLAILMGLAIGYMVSWGAGRGGAAVGLVAAVIGLVTVVLSYFYIDRLFIVRALEDQGYVPIVSLWPKYDTVHDVLKISFENEPSQYLLCAICIGAAGIFGYRGLESSRRFNRRR